MRLILVILVLVALLIGCGSSGGGDQPPEPPPPPIECDEGYELVDGECIPIPPPPPEVVRVCLEWDPVIHPDLDGYIMYYGKVSGQYDIEIPVDVNYTDICIEDESYFMKGTPIFFACTATSNKGEESDYSNEVIWEPT